MPATSPVYYGKSLYYRCTDLELYDSSEDIRDDGWDDGGGGGGGARSATGDSVEESEEPSEESVLELERGAKDDGAQLTVAIARPMPSTTTATSAEVVRDLLVSAVASFTPEQSVTSGASFVSRLIEYIVARRAEFVMASSSSSTTQAPTQEPTLVDGLCCPICEGVLRYPVTATCGHTFCRQCCFGHSSCTVCGQRFPSVVAPVPPPVVATSSTVVSVGASPSTSSTAISGGDGGAVALELTRYGAVDSSTTPSSSLAAATVGFEQDILIRRLVERWWGPELKAAELQEEAQRHLEAHSLDEALRCCNQSLEHGKSLPRPLL